MICPNCKARNPIGNKFCRECGEKLVLPEGSLAAEEAARVSAERDAEKYAAILVEAHALSDARKFDEAIVLGEEAAQILPKSTSAYSLLATLYERTEQEQKAIAAMETVVALNPASEADKIKLDQLKRGVHVLPRHVPAASDTRLRESAPLPWMPLVLAGVVTVSVLLGGLFWLNRSQKNRAAAVPTTVARPVSAPPVSAANPNGVAPEYVAPTPLYGGATVPAPPQPVSQVRPDPFAPMGGNPSPTPSPRALPGTTRRTSSPPPVAPVTVAPPPGVSGGAGATSPLPPISAGPPSSGPQSGGGGGSDPSAPAGFGSGGRLPVAPPPQPPANGGGNNNSPFPPGSPTGSLNGGAGSGGGNAGSYIHISVGGASGGSSGNSSRPAVSSPQSPLSRARAFQQAGQYNEAIGAYRQAIASGSSAGSAYQNIAQCYESLGEPGGARSAYRDAIRAYETSGKGSPSAAALRGIASCKAALEVLGGG